MTTGRLNRPPVRFCDESTSLVGKRPFPAANDAILHVRRRSPGGGSGVSLGMRFATFRRHGGSED